MKEEKRAYEHEAEVTGTGDGDPATEHQDTARGDAEDRNEIDAPHRGPEERGPTTRESTRIDRGGV